MEPKDIVRRGYDALSYRYRGDTEEPEHYATWLAQLRERVPAGGTVLDLGCGCGVPLTRDLAAGGYVVTGVDMPLDEQPSLLGRIGRWLRPGGWFLATTGHRAWTGTEDGWLGGEAPMWWSHADAASYSAWIEEAGLAVVDQEVVAEDEGVHALFWARRPLDLPR